MPKQATPKQWNIHDAKTQLSKLLAVVESGEEVLIARAGKPIARVSPVESPKTMKAGWAGTGLKMADDFDELPEEILASFER
jgi:prevent-host-death family protein